MGDIEEQIKFEKLLKPKEGDVNSIINIKEQKLNRLNTCIYVDYENIFKQLAKYKIDPIKIKFFERIKLFLESQNLNIIDFILYSNYDCEIFNRDAQTKLQGLGLQTRHTSNKGKNAGDLEMSIDALKTLYKNSFIDVFVIMSCDRDMIPLIKAIKAENKISYVISTKIGFNKIVATYADEHRYIEDLFTEIVQEKENVTILNEVAKSNSKDESEVKEIDPITKDIKIICKYLFKYKYWKEYLKGNGKVKVKGFSKAITKNTRYNVTEIDEILKRAKDLKYIDLIQENNELIITQNTNTVKYTEEILK